MFPSWPTDYSTEDNFICGSLVEKESDFYHCEIASWRNTSKFCVLGTHLVSSVELSGSSISSELLYLQGKLIGFGCVLCFSGFANEKKTKNLCVLLFVK